MRTSLIFYVMAFIDFIPLIGSAFGSIFNMQAAEDTNATNQAINSQNLAHQIVQNTLNRKFTEKQNQLSRDFNAEQAAISRQFQEDMWNKQNAYNSPVNQLKLLQDAGYNPNLFSQSVSSAGGLSSTASASSSPSSASTSSLPSSIPNQPAFLDLNSLTDSYLKMVQAQSIKRETEREDEKQPYVIRGLEADITLKDSQSDWTKEDKERIKAQIPILNQQLRNMQEELLNSQEVRNLTKLQGKELDQRIDSYAQEFEARLRNIKLEGDMYIANAKAAYSQVLLNAAKAEEAKASANASNAAAQLSADQHIMNGVELEFASKYGTQKVQYMYDEMQQKYNIVLSQAKDMSSKVQKSEHWNWRNKAWYNPQKYGLYVLEATEHFTNSIGFSSSFNVSPKSPSVKP